MWSNWQSRRIYIVRVVVGFVEHFSFHFFIINANQLSLSLETAEQIRRKYNKKLNIIHVMILWISREQLKATLTRFNKFAKCKKHKFYLLKQKKNQFFNNLCWLVLSTRILCSYIFI